MRGRSARELAVELLEMAYRRQMAGALVDAIRLYKRSIALEPTAEGHTFLGWAYSFEGRLDEAIEECKRAIGLDPDFGNPYNDIGAYLIQKKHFDEAIPWLLQAKRAARYEPRHFPCLNLGRVYLAKGELARALEEFRAAVRLHPNDPLATEAIRHVQTHLN